MSANINLKIRNLCVISCVATGITGCSTGGLIIGSKYGDPPPQVVFLGARDAAGKDYLTWDRPWNFGPVPAELQAAGDIGCMRLESSLRAVGYHPRAMNRAGQETPGGGFFCQPQLLPDFSRSEPPRLVMKDGQLGWDRPAAFGPVPASRSEAAAQECTKQNPKAVPLGFHPRPIGADGRPMEQGGYLCVY
jgi:hypothetical protein